MQQPSWITGRAYRATSLPLLSIEDLDLLGPTPDLSERNELVYQSDTQRSRGDEGTTRLSGKHMIACQPHDREGINIDALYTGEIQQLIQIRIEVCVLSYACSEL
jgi:hypothetical protein